MKEKLSRMIRWFILPAMLMSALFCQYCRINREFEFKEEEHEKGVSGAMQALDFWAAQRAYPFNAVPDRGFGEAVEQVGKMKRQSDLKDDIIEPWELIGPYNIGGRTLCLTLHPENPDIIYAGSASGGLWKSTTGGVGAEAWEYVETGFPVLGVSTIVIDPGDPDVMYIGTGEVYRYQDSIGGEVIRTTRGSYGIGILKTTDAGATWFKSLDWSYAQTRGIWMLALHPEDSTVLYAATTEGVLKSTDAGDSWETMLDVRMAMDVRIHPVSPNIIFAACGNFSSEGVGIYRSMNNGLIWSRLTNGLPGSWSGKAQLNIAETDTDRIYVSIAETSYGRGLYRSTDMGDSWVQVNSTDYPQYQGWYSHYVLVSPFDEDFLFTGGIEIWRSQDGGQNLSERSDWTEIYLGSPPPEGPIGGPHYAHADHHYAVWHPYDPDTVFFASDGGVFKTTDGGDTFQSLIGGYATTQFYNGFASSAHDPNLAIGGMQDNLTAIYQGEAAWRRVIGGDGAWAAINPLDNDTLYGSAQYLYMVRSRNGGSNWTEIEPPSQSGDNTAFVAPYVLCPSNPQILYAGRSRVYKSTDEGSNWFATNNGARLDGANPVLCLDVAFTNEKVVYAGTAPINNPAGFYRTLDGGMSWQEVTGSLPDRYPADCYVDPNEPARVIVTFMGYDNSHVFLSEDAGDSWQDISAGLPDLPVSAAAIDPEYPDVFYAGADLGVFCSTDAGVSWSPFQNGMPTAMVIDLKIFQPQRKIRAATHGNGVFERNLIQPHMPTVSPAISPTAMPTLIPPTPTPAINFGVDIILPQNYFSPGDTFTLSAKLINNGQTRPYVPFFCILDIYGRLFFYPSWSEYPPDVDWEYLPVPSGITEKRIIEAFTWPPIDQALDGLFFHAAFLDESFSAIEGRMDTEGWGYGP